MTPLKVRVSILKNKIQAISLKQLFEPAFSPGVTVLLPHNEQTCQYIASVSDQRPVIVEGSPLTQ